VPSVVVIPGSLTAMRVLVELFQGYRMLVLSRLPKLQALDFSPVTKADRKTAETLGNFYRAAAAGKKKRKKDEE